MAQEIDTYRLTEEELHAMKTGEGNKYIKTAAESKLEKFQRFFVDESYVKAVDSFISVADMLANRAVSKAGIEPGEKAKLYHAKIYHQEMMRLTREAGLRR